MIQQRIRDDMTRAMREKDAIRVSVLRSVLSEFTNELLAKKRKPTDELSDDEALAVIKRAANQRKDSIEQFTRGGRADLAEKEQRELVILAAYLPEQMSREEIEKVVAAKKEGLGITDKSGMGQLMGAVMAELKNKADGAEVKEVVESSFT